MSEGLAVRKVLVDRWTPLLGGAPVLEFVPTGTPMPYVELGEIDWRPDGGKGEGGLVGELTVHSWSIRGGVAEVEEFQAAMRGALHEWEPELEGFSSIGFELLSDRAFKDADGVTGHGVSRWRVRTEPV